MCKGAGEMCSAAIDCCTLNCKGGVCDPKPGCTQLDAACTVNADCCSNLCQGGVCAQGGGCLQPGEDCAVGGSVCCSGVCQDMGNGKKWCGQPLGGCLRQGATAGEALTLSARGGVTTFKENRVVPLALTLAGTTNLHVKAVHVQVWSGVQEGSRQKMLHGFIALLVAVVALFMWWQKNRG